MFKRIILDIFLIISLFTLPWWVTSIFAIAGIFLFARYFEFILVAVLMHSLYAVSSVSFVTKPLFFYTVTLVLFVGIQMLRRNIIYYQE